MLSVPTYDYVFSSMGYQFDLDEYWHVPLAAERESGNGGLGITSYEVYERTDTERKNLIYSEYGYIDGNEHEVDLEMLARGMLWNALGYKVVLKNDDNFEKTVDMLETYFKNGGVHFQLTYVSKEDLMKAKETPDNYSNLRVRVSGFSDYFVKLGVVIQDEIIERTSHK